MLPESKALHPPRNRGSCRFRAGRHAGLAALLIAGMQLLPDQSLAGGGPEKVLVVVNGDSAVSMQIANRYVEMRDIPPENVLWLHDIPYPDSIGIDTFRTRIWKPIRDFITRNQLDDEIDIITYSAGFPYAVNFSADLKANKLPRLKYHGKMASLTGLTYFARHVETASPYYLASNAKSGKGPAAQGGKALPEKGFPGSACRLRRAGSGFSRAWRPVARAGPQSCRPG
jgi:hypothetical protein